MADIKKIYEEISSAVFEYRSAVNRNTGIAGAKDRVKNMMFTHRDLILSALSETEALRGKVLAMEEELDAMGRELAEVDHENIELRKKVREAEEQAKPKGRSKVKTMTAVVE